jgi:hypothetical protein
VDRYKFLKVPQTLEEYDEAKGVTFRHGKFQYTRGKETRDVVIDSLQVYNNGLLADTRSDTEDADEFIDDLLAWAVKTYDITIPAQRVEQIYLSNLEISSSKTLSNYIPSSKDISEELARYLTEYGIKHEPFEPVSFALHFDKTVLPNSLLTNFTLQRRETVPFSSGLYFSSAPLKTKDHLALLEKLDGVAKH